ncbi:MAG: MOSC domain-containing protein [Synoicihabitans sp.]
MSEIRHLSATELEQALPELVATPSEMGRLDLIIRRPAENGRESIAEGRLSESEGLEGDNWIRGRANPECQLTLMNSRAADLVAAGDRSRWALAGDQLYVEFDLSDENLPAGTRVHIGNEAIVEVTAEPHTGCEKFISRFGIDAMKFVNSPQGRSLNLRGINTKVIRGGVIRVGDELRKQD